MVEPACRDNTGAPVTKVYFDSANRVSGSNTDLRWNIPGGQTLRTSEKAYVAVATGFSNYEQVIPAQPLS